MPRLHPGRAHRPRSGALSRSGQARRHARHPGMAELLFQISHVRAAALSRARSLYPIDEIEKYFALDDGRRPDHPPGFRVLRLTILPRPVSSPWCRESLWFCYRLLSKTSIRLIENFHFTCAALAIILAA